METVTLRYKTKLLSLVMLNSREREREKAFVWFYSATFCFDLEAKPPPPQLTSLYVTYCVIAFSLGEFANCNCFLMWSRRLVSKVRTTTLYKSHIPSVKKTLCSSKYLRTPCHLCYCWRKHLFLIEIFIMSVLHQSTWLHCFCGNNFRNGFSF